MAATIYSRSIATRPCRSSTSHLDNLTAVSHTGQTAADQDHIRNFTSRLTVASLTPSPRAIRAWTPYPMP